MPKGQYQRTKVICNDCGKEFSNTTIARHRRAFHENKRSQDYFACHWRIRQILGTPPECLLCSEKTKRRCWANLSGNFNDPTDYIPLCDSCHLHFDALERDNTGERYYIRCKICNKLVRSKKSDLTHKYCSKNCLFSDPDWRKQLTGRRKKDETL